MHRQHTEPPENRLFFFETQEVGLLVRLPDEEISTGYGTHWPEREQDLAYYLALADKAGFTVTEQRESDRVFVLKLQRP